MTKIISSDSRVFNYKPELIFKAVSDVTEYEKWWSKKVKITVVETYENLTGSKVEIKAFGGWFRCEIVSVIPFKEVKIKYYDGVQLGDGIWKLGTDEKGSTKLTYEIELVPNGFIPKLFSFIVDYSKIHSKAMIEMFDGLDDYLSKKII